MGDSVQSLFSGSSNNLSRTSISEIDETTTCDFRILSETLPKVFLLSGDNQSTQANLDVLKASLAGALFLAECYGHYHRRCLARLWRYGLRRHAPTTLHIAAKFSDLRRGGWVFLIGGCTPPIQIHETVLERRLSGRVLTRGFTKQPLLSFLWQEIKRKGIPYTV